MTEVYNILCNIYNLLKKHSDPMLAEYRETDTSIVPISNSGNVPQRVAGRNPNRVEIWIQNDSEENMYLAPAAAESVSRDLFSLVIKPGDTLILNSHNYAQLYKKEVYGFWAEGAPTTARAMITEFSTRS